MEGKGSTLMSLPSSPSQIVVLEQVLVIPRLLASVPAPWGSHITWELCLPSPPDPHRLITFGACWSLANGCIQELPFQP